MRKLIVFDHITLDGYFCDPNGDMSFFHNRFKDDEFYSFAVDNIKAAGALLFGRVTYELMVAYWPTADAIKADPAIAERMNTLPKFVFSRTLAKTPWNNTQLMKGDLVSEVRKLKEAPGNRIAILGSGNIVAQLAPHGLIDEYEIVVNPVAIGAGRTIFERINAPLNLKLTKTRAFRNGNILLCYEPMA
ncbi:MAG: dihydrofolate reductase family protein [Candidatus Acidiferrales bacterium]